MKLDRHMAACLMVLKLVSGVALNFLAGTATAAALDEARNVMPLTWELLLPEKERGGFQSAAPAPLHGYLDEGDPAALQVGSYQVNTQLDGKWVRLPGFVVPLKRDKDGLISDFFLVPYFGACIHVPPPPPNQIVYVHMHSGADLSAMDDAQWVTGRMRTAVRTTSLGAAAYVLEGIRLEKFSRPDSAR